MAEKLPQKFGPYTLQELVARGGMAEIFRATMPGIGGFEKVVAIKKILPHLAENEEFITMLIDEARIIVSINHANIAQVYDLGVIDDTYYIAMEYIHGVDLSTIVKNLARDGKHVPAAHATYIGSCICAGLHMAHSKTDEAGRPLNIVHRDISPHNVLLSFAGDVKVIDFGVAKASVKESHTQMGVIKGKLLYMAPEQAMARDIDGRADLFAAGLCMYKMLTNRLPFEGDNEFQIYNNILNKEIVPPKVLNPEVPDILNTVIMKILARNPDERYQDGYSAKHDLDRVLHQIAPGYTVTRLSRFIEENFKPGPAPQQKPTGSALTPASAPKLSPQEEALLPEIALDFAPEPVAPAQAPFGSMGPGSSQPNPQPFGAFGAESLSNPAWSAPQGQRTAMAEHSTGQFQMAPSAGSMAGEEPPKSRGKSRGVLLGLVALLLVLGLAGAGYAVHAGLIVLPGGEPPMAAAPVSAPAATVTISLSSEPSGARVSNGGEALGVTPAVFTLARSAEPVTLTLELDGHESVTFRLAPTADLVHTLVLKALVPAAPEPPAQPDAGASPDAQAAPDAAEAPAEVVPEAEQAPAPAPVPAPAAAAPVPVPAAVPAKPVAAPTAPTAPKPVDPPKPAAPKPAPRAVPPKPATLPPPPAADPAPVPQPAGPPKPPKSPKRPIIDPFSM